MLWTNKENLYIFFDNFQLKIEETIMPFHVSQLIWYDMMCLNINRKLIFEVKEQVQEKTDGI